MAEKKAALAKWARHIRKLIDKGAGRPPRARPQRHAADPAVVLAAAAQRKQESQNT